MNKKATFFIEGLEHKRFVEPYIKILENIFEVEILSFEDIHIENHETNILDKDTFNKNLLNIKSSLFITTTPGVGNSYFSKSRAFPIKDRPKYVYVFHSLVSPNEVYSKKSFSGFDIIFSPNNLITNQLKYLVSSKTKIYTTGYPLITSNYYSKIKFSNSKNRLLIAPSWGESSLFKVINLDSLLKNFHNKDIEVTLRPHPMELNLLEDFKKYTNITLDYDKDLNNLAEYNYLISDWSGISIEYSIVANRKTIFIDTPKKVRRKLKNTEKNLILIENEIRNSLGIVLEGDKYKDLSYLLNNDELFKITDKEYLEKIISPEFKDFQITKYLEENI